MSNNSYFHHSCLNFLFHSSGISAIEKGLTLSVGETYNLRLTSNLIINRQTTNLYLKRVKGVSISLMNNPTLPYMVQRLVETLTLEGLKYMSIFCDESSHFCLIWSND